MEKTRKLGFKARNAEHFINYFCLIVVIIKNENTRSNFILEKLINIPLMITVLA